MTRLRVLGVILLGSVRRLSRVEKISAKCKRLTANYRNSGSFGGWFPTFTRVQFRGPQAGPQLLITQMNARILQILSFCALLCFAPLVSALTITQSFGGSLAPVIFPPFINGYSSGWNFHLYNGPSPLTNVRIDMLVTASGSATEINIWDPTYPLSVASGYVPFITTPSLTFTSQLFLYDFAFAPIPQISTVTLAPITVPYRDTVTISASVLQTHSYSFAAAGDLANFTGSGESAIVVSGNLGSFQHWGVQDAQFTVSGTIRYDVANIPDSGPSAALLAGAMTLVGLVRRNRRE